MPLPAAGIALLNLAEGAVAGALGTLAGEVLYDAMTSHRLLTVDPDTDEILETSIDLSNIPMSNPSMRVSQLATDPDSLLRFQVEDGEDVVALFELSERASTSQAQVTAANKTMNSLARNDAGPSLLRDLAEAVENARDATGNEAQYDAADTYNRRAVAQSPAARNAGLTDETRRNIRQDQGKQDRSRISKEYHEWKYCVVDSGDYVEMTEFNTGKGIVYVGTDKLILDTGEWAPPYHRWIQFEDFRKLMIIYRRYKRLRSRCGGKALYVNQGHADKRAAIQDDCENDSEFQSLCAALAAETEWQLT